LACIALIVLPPWRLTRLVPDRLVLDDDAKLDQMTTKTIPFEKNFYSKSSFPPEISLSKEN